MGKLQQAIIIIKERRANPKLPPLTGKGDALIIFSEAHSPQFPSSKKKPASFFFCSLGKNPCLVHIQKKTLTPVWQKKEGEAKEVSIKSPPPPVVYHY